MILSLNFGASGQFFIGTDTSGFTIGINLFALIALLLLLRSNKALKSQASPAGAPAA